MNEKKNGRIVYHAHCTDGWTAAFVAAICWFPSRDEELGEIEFVPASYKDNLLEREDLGEVAETIVVDFSLPPEDLDQFVERWGGDIYTLDHHQSALHRYKAVLGEGLQRVPSRRKYVATHSSGRGKIIFNLDRSGAALAWESFSGGGIRQDVSARGMRTLVAYVEDRDLWRFRLARSREVNAKLQILPKGEEHLDLWVDIANRMSSPQGVLEIANEGRQILSSQDALVERALSNAFVLEEESIEEILDGRLEEGVAVCNSSLLQSEIGNALLDKYPEAPYAAVWHQTSSGIKVSLRSEGSRSDVSKVAETYGGGGHRNAAGFYVHRKRKE